MLWMQLHERWKSHTCSWCSSFGVKYGEKLMQTIIDLRKLSQSKVYSYPIKNVWISSLILIFIFWWTELNVWSHIKICQSFIINFEDIWEREFVFDQALSAFFQWHPASSWMLVETSYSDRFDMLYFSNFMRSWLIVQI